MQWDTAEWQGEEDRRATEGDNPTWSKRVIEKS